MVMHLAVPPILRRRGAMENAIPNVLNSIPSLALSSSVVLVDGLP